MDFPSQERNSKKKLQSFLQELQRFGTLRGFRHFHCYVRSKEELIVSVNNTLQTDSLTHSGNSSVQPNGPPCPSENLSSSHLPYDKSSLVVPRNSQARSTSPRARSVALPAASPSGEECTPCDTNVTLFLIAGYAHYSCPYVWVRSNHERLFKLSSDADNDRNCPLRLKSTAIWKDGDVQVTDIIAEIVKLCTFPAPWNPFEIDLQFFQTLSQPEQLLSSAAMVTCLQSIVVQTSVSKLYTAKVFEDLQEITRLHFMSLKEMVTAADISVFQEKSTYHHCNSQCHQQEQTGHHHPPQDSRQRRPSLQSRYPKVLYPATTTPVIPHTSNNPPVTTSGIIYGQDFCGVFPGGFNRMPAPSLL